MKKNPNKILRLLFQFQLPFVGQPNFVSGNAFRHALSRQVNSSIGIFSTTKGLKYPRDYDDFFKIRMKYVSFPFQEHFWFCKIDNKEKITKYHYPEGITFDLINPPEDIVKEIKSKEIRFGKFRNKGAGKVRLVDSLWIELEDLDMPETVTHLELISPIFQIPLYVHSYKCRHLRYTFWNKGSWNNFDYVARGQFFRLKDGNDVRKIALKGMLKKSLWGKFGLGEFKLVEYNNGGN